MGFYLRTSLRAGPFRLNLSPAGIGISAGIPGFRVGAGPRGNYVRIGGQGVYYASAPRQVQMPRTLAERYGTPATPPTGGDVALHELDGASLQQLVAAHPSDVVAQIAATSRRISIWPFAAGFIALATLLTIPYGLVLLLPGVPAVVWLYLYDRARRSVVVFYQVDDEPAAQFERLAAVHAFSRQTHRCWHVEAQGSLVTPYQQKVNAGASAVIRRSPLTLTLDGPPVLVTNIAVPTLNTRSRSVYFLPDRALVRQGNQYAELPYSSLYATAQPQRFIEDGPVPADSRIVDITWQYTNTNGGPDRRFKHNRQLPVMLYGRLTLSNPYGFLMIWDFSRPDIAEALARAIRAMR